MLAPTLVLLSIWAFTLSPTKTDALADAKSKFVFIFTSESNVVFTSAIETSAFKDAEFTENLASASPATASIDN